MLDVILKECFVHSRLCLFALQSQKQLKGNHFWNQSVQSLNCVWLFPIPYTSAHQASLSIINSSCSNSCPLSWWCHPTILSSVIPFSFHLQFFPASASCTMSQFFVSGGQSIRASASASVLPMNIQDWFPLGWNGWISLQFKGLSRVFSNTTVKNHQFFGIQSPTSVNDYWTNHSFD